MALPAPPHLVPVTPTPSPPELPEKWHAIALLTPFPTPAGQPQAPWVAEITYDWSVEAMLVQLQTLDGASLAMMAVGQNQAYMIEDGKCCGPQNWPNWTVPSPTWLADRNLTCQGTADVLGVDCQWWSGTTPCDNSLEHSDSGPPCQGNTWCAGAWFWSRTDNGFLSRLMFISTGNPYSLPILGEVALVNFTTFDEVGTTKLPQILASCSDCGANAPPATNAVHMTRLAGVWPQSHGAGQPSGDIASILQHRAQTATAEEKATVVEEIASKIPGLKPLPGTCAPYTLPVWPDTLYMTALTTPTFPYQDASGPNAPWYYAPFPTAIYYDWENKPSPAQLSRFFQPDGTMQDTLLLNPTSYGVDRDANGNVTACGPLDPNPNDPNIGPPYRNWPQQDGSVCLALIDNNPNLSPGRKTMIIGCPSDSGRCFYIWYTTDGQAVMFCEVPQCCDVSLTLIDYFDFEPNTPNLPPGIFDIPPQCQQGG